jgi:hypothetical protein
VTVSKQKFMQEREEGVMGLKRKCVKNFGQQKEATGRA